jgi:hypothetical protein
MQQKCCIVAEAAFGPPARQGDTGKGNRRDTLATSSPQRCPRSQQQARADSEGEGGRDSDTPDDGT